MTALNAPASVILRYSEGSSHYRKPAGSFGTPQDDVQRPHINQYSRSMDVPPVLRKSGIASPCIMLTLIFLLIPGFASAHPLSQGSLDVVIHSDKIFVHARVSSEEVAITNSTTGNNPLPGPWAATGSSAFEQHAEYLAAHLHFRADGQLLTGRVVKVTPPDDQSPTNSVPATYDFEYLLPTASPQTITLRQDALADARLPAGQSWVTLYLVTLSQPGKSVVQTVLSRSDQMTYTCAWSDAGSSAKSQPSSRAALFKSYCIHGIDHILGEPTGRGIFHRTDVGWDHLLFVSALVLGTRSLWELLKVVTAFTIAHTITLTLAATKVVPDLDRIAEPLIAASIVFVAMQNVFWPSQTHGPWRFAAAFFFGLFHGLGFAGGLLDTMREMHGSTIALVIVAFSLGVELGHQFVVLPLFMILKLTRETHATELARERLRLNVQRIGSAFISLAGLFYLVLALRMSFGLA